MSKYISNWLVLGPISFEHDFGNVNAAEIIGIIDQIYSKYLSVNNLNIFTPGDILL